MSRIRVDVCSSTLDIAEHWQRLVDEATVNVFMHPEALNAVAATDFARTHVLLAWDESMVPARLVGLWALEEKKVAPLWPAFLAAPPYNYAFVSTPVVDIAHMNEVIPAFFDAIAHHPSLPKVIRLNFLDGGSKSYGAIVRALEARRASILKLSEGLRPFASRECGRKRSGSTRKKLRQDWNRLAALGAVAIVNDRDVDAVRAAFEVFLAMEAESWKGARGTALLSNAKDATFVRRLISELARRQSASVALLRADGRPIAAQVLLYCGRVAYTWKTAFDAEFRKFSPGALLVDGVTDQLFATADIDAIESCSPEGSFMGDLWTGRRTTVNLLIDVRARRSVNFFIQAMAERRYADLRRMRRKLRSVSWSRISPLLRSVTARSDRSSAQV